MKKLFVLTSMALFTVAASARLPFIDMGVKVGLTSPKTSFNAKTLGNYDFKSSNVLGWHAGVQARVNLAMFNIQPEILYNHYAYNAKLAVKGSGNYSTAKVKINTLDVPILFGVKMIMFRFQVGPQFTLMTDHSFSGGKYLDGALIAKPEISWVANFGADLSRFTADIRYNGYFSRTDHTLAPDGGTGQRLRSKDSSWSFSLGYMF